MLIGECWVVFSFELQKNIHILTELSDFLTSILKLYHCQ